jgi:phage terminase large subunit-like protein
VIPVAQALAYCDAGHLEALPEAERIVAAFAAELWLRPEQRVPLGAWRSCGLICGRGWGKTHGFAREINRRVLRGEVHPPSASSDGIALVAPTEPRVLDVQVKALVAHSPPWFRAEEYRGGVRWPNGARAFAFTPEAPERCRSGNFELAWLTELVDWSPNTAIDTWQAVTTATRVGPRPQYLWDSTSKGKTEVILRLLDQHEAEPAKHLLRRGTMFDNPFLKPGYLRDEVLKYGVGTRRYREEVLGEVFAEAAGALWEQAWIDDNRRAAPRDLYDLIVLGVDPAISTHEASDDTGIIAAGRDGRDVDVLDDLSGRHTPEQWTAILLDWHLNRGAAGCVIERNRGGNTLVPLIRARAESVGVRVEVLHQDAGKQPFPRRTPGRFYVREVWSSDSKASRAQGPSVLYLQGRVHHVGVFTRLELQQTTWEPGSTRSPNNLDALAFAVSELAGLTADAAPVPDVSGAAAVAKALDAGRRSDRGGRGLHLSGRGRLGL